MPNLKLMKVFRYGDLGIVSILYDDVKVKFFKIASTSQTSRLTIERILHEFLKSELTTFESSLHYNALLCHFVFYS